MRSPRRRVPATPSESSDSDGHRRQPFRAVQPRRASSSPLTPTLPAKTTPPREVFLTPRATPKPLKRKTTSRTKRTAPAKVKSEPPEVDLSKVRPPSPSDDPLLLSGTRSIRSPSLRARFTPVFSSSPSCTDPQVSFAARLTAGRVGGLDSSPGADAHALPIFNVPRAAVEETGGAWSDSDDDDGFNLTGEYTGKYKILRVPTMAGPPKDRTEPWGRPVSPFPYSEVMERSFAADAEGRDDIQIPCEDAAMWEVATEPPLSDVELSPQVPVTEDEFVALDDDFPLFDVAAESTQVFPLPGPREDLTDLNNTILEQEEEEEEAQIDRALSEDIADSANIPLPKVGEPDTRMEDDSSDEEDDVKGEDIIKITSADSKAAARAAAILRMHDYDCILAAEKKKPAGRSSKSSRTRRKTIENAGISKSYADLRSPRWHTLQGDKLSPGSRSLPLLELWRDAEDSVFLEHHSMSFCDTSFTLSPLKATTARSEPLLSPPTGKWTRDCWKSLDKCLVAERLAIAATRGQGVDVFADVGDISKDAVLNRFVNQLGGESILIGLGPEWSRDNLIMRLDVLIKKQSRHAKRARVTRRHDPLGTTELRYRELLQEALALSGKVERSLTSSSISSDATVVFGPRDASKMNLADLSSSSYSTEATGDLRGPIRTPSRTPEPRPPHPRDQIRLRHASVAQNPEIPVPALPKRLVDLRHFSPIKADHGRHRSAARRSSGCSVKDLVRQYESLDQ